MKVKEFIQDGKIHSEGTCKQCGTIGRCEIVMGPFGPHYAKAVCSECGAFIKWIKKNLPIKITGIKRR